MRSLALISLLCLLLLVGCGESEKASPADPAPKAAEAPAPTEADADLVRLVAWMTGSFDSAAQAQADPDYFEIHLHMARLWPERTDAIYLYVEQAVGGAPEKPYRQRVYRVVAAGEGVYDSAVWELPDPKAWVGAWKADFERPTLGPDALIEREGCTVQLKLQADGTFKGSTPGNACKSVLHGSTYATSEVTVHEHRVVSWDRGFNDAGEQVWGAEKAGYVFEKRVDHPLGDVTLD